NIHAKNSLALCYLLRGDTDRAQKYVDDALRYSPNSMDLHFTKGKICLKKGDSTDAVSEFRTVINQNSQFIAGYLALSEAHILNDQTELAIQTLRKPLKNDPKSFDLLYALARAYTVKKDFPAARETLQKIMEYYPDRYQAHADLGDLFAAQKDYPKAEREYREVLKKEPNSAFGHMKLAQLYADQGKWVLASSQLEEGYRRNTDSPVLLSSLIKVYMMGLKSDKAISLCEARVRENPRDAFAFNILGKLYSTVRDYAKAEAAFTKAMQIQPVWPEPYSNLARLYMARGRKNEAIKRFEQAVSKSSKDPTPYLALGMIYEQSGEYAKASQIYTKILAAIPDLWPAANNLAFLLAEHPAAKDDLSRAVTLARKAREIRPDDPDVIDTLGWAYYKTGDLKQAFAYIKTALDKDAQNPIYNYHMGMISFKKGQKSDARDRLLTALKGSERFYGREDAERTLAALQR
ncbi:MAG TPA: tetratricopeptide repeat protein, partial [Deltaproteobacteria bacterium]|nr:tetratricopeptide repeat protein [Deltaproteobacteria bacterium]